MYSHTWREEIIKMIIKQEAPELKKDVNFQTEKGHHIPYKIKVEDSHLDIFC